MTNQPLGVSREAAQGFGVRRRSEAQSPLFDRVHDLSGITASPWTKAVTPPTPSAPTNEFLSIQ
jgi:hypothetical protein